MGLTGLAMGHEIMRCNGPKCNIELFQDIRLPNYKKSLILRSSFTQETANIGQLVCCIEMKFNLRHANYAIPGWVLRAEVFIFGAFVVSCDNR